MISGFKLLCKGSPAELQMPGGPEGGVRLLRTAGCRLRSCPEAPGGCWVARTDAAAAAGPVVSELPGPA